MLTSVHNAQIFMSNPAKAAQMGANPYFGRILSQGIDAQSLPGGAKASACKTCGEEVERVTTDSEVYGGIVAYPSRCSACRAASYAQHVSEQNQKSHENARVKCCGRQNKPAVHEGRIVTYNDMRDGYEFQKRYLSYMQQVIDGNESRGAFVYGPTGTGKTFLLKMMHNELLQKHEHSVFVKAVELAMILRREAMGDQYKEVFKHFSNVKYLFIDDFGVQKNTEFIREAMFSIFDTRYDNKKTTIFSSNLNMRDLEKSDARVASRIQDPNWCLKIMMKNEDLRKQRVVDVPYWT